MNVLSKFISTGVMLLFVVSSFAQADSTSTHGPVGDEIEVTSLILLVLGQNLTPPLVSGLGIIVVHPDIVSGKGTVIIGIRFLVRQHVVLPCNVPRSRHQRA